MWELRLPLPAPSHHTFPNCSSNYCLLFSGERPADADKAVTPCVIQPCLLLWPCPSSLTPRLPLPKPKPQNSTKVPSFHLPVVGCAIPCFWNTSSFSHPPSFSYLSSGLAPRSLFLNLDEMSLFWILSCTLIKPILKLLLRDLVIAC